MAAAPGQSKAAVNGGQVVDKVLGVDVDIERINFANGVE
jgi:hypothetical protein